jgi:hypothetical protein
MRIGSVLLLAVAAAFGVSAAIAADADMVRSAPSGVTVVAPIEGAPPPYTQETVKIKRPGPPDIAFGCKRVWRCDAQVCEWRRGCYGVYGYVEAPYYAKPLAQRQWESHGLPGAGTETSGSARRRAYIAPTTDNK